MPSFDLRVASGSTSSSSSRTVSFDVRKLVLAGFAGRNQEEVRKHIKELELLGVTPPDSVPTRYDMPPVLLTTNGSVAVRSSTTSGEVEAVLLIDRDETYVGIGSDLTDREIEKTSVLQSKTSCPKPIGKEVWRFRDVVDHWDKLIVKSFVKVNDSIVPYQSSELNALLRPEKLLEMFDDCGEGTAIYCGTPALLRETTFSDYFAMTLTDPVINAKISHEYRVQIPA